MHEGRDHIMREWSKRRRAAAAALAVVVIAVLGVAAANRVVYGGFNPWSAPERLEWCGAHFYRTGGEEDSETAAPLPVAMQGGGGPQAAQSPDAVEGTPGDGAVVTKAQALSDSAGTTLVAHGTIGIFGTWNVFVPGGFQCPQDPETEQLDSVMFVELGPDRYLEMTDAD
jgi:hypothetical protein